MGIHEDARSGTLTKAKLDAYVRNNARVLDEQDPSTGLTPLAAATVGGFTDEIELLLKKGAKADAPSRNGETPLLLANWKTTTNRPRIVQLILAKTPPGSVDATTRTAQNNTPLMWAIKNRDIESIRLLRKANASLTQRNNDGKTAKQLADEANDPAIVRALSPDREQSALGKLSAMVISFLLYVTAWVNKAANEVIRRTYGLNPPLDEDLDDDVNGPGGEQPTKDEFVENVDKYLKENPTLERFFKDKPNYIQELTRKAADLERDTSTPLGCSDVLPKVIKVTLHQQVIYCDDSSSMKRDGRWNAQKALVSRIAKITTRILPEGEGVALRFINQNVQEATNLSFNDIGAILENTSWAPNGDTEIGTYLRLKILEPLVYNKIDTINRPLLISVITDGMPSVEDPDTFVNVIAECGRRLEDAGLPRDTVKFVVGQIGTAKSAAKFLQSVKNNRDIASVVYVTSEQLDEKFAEFKANEGELDRWLIETLFEPIKNPQ